MSGTGDDGAGSDSSQSSARMYVLAVLVFAGAVAVAIVALLSTSGTGSGADGASQAASTLPTARPAPPTPTAGPTPTPAPTPTPLPTATPTVVPTPGSVSAESASTERFTTLPVGAVLPTEAECAGRVRPAPEVRPLNMAFNQTPGSSPHDDISEVTGNFVGTTDELIQWAACKWGVDEDLVRAQMAVESWWFQTAEGDFTTDQSLCHPDVRTAADRCPESMGLSQIKYQFHPGAYEDSNVIRSTAYNLDYAYSFWRRCYEGEFTWLNDEERGREYGAGDETGCLGVWFWGRWYTAEGIEYMDQVEDYLQARIWETADFLSATGPQER